MEDIHVAYDNTVRNGKKSIIQFNYGITGIDTCKLEKDSLGNYNQII